MGPQLVLGPSRALDAVVSVVEAPSSRARLEVKACAPGPQAVPQGSSVCGEVFQDFSGIRGIWDPLNDIELQGKEVKVCDSHAKVF